MYLPRATGADRPIASGTPTVEGGHETILVVEDDKLVRDYVLTQIECLGYVTLEAATRRKPWWSIDSVSNSICCSPT